ncbi:MAG TPA: BtpA/SgcQ family protein [Candidatus Nanoarchaeia archaeon]|nr:BtpA/SgcQ family protein [Candidatus Nanoarchaeia archaeon]
MLGFSEVFPVPKPILGMIHLAGESPIQRALEELAIFEEEGIDGAIIENYHDSAEDVEETLRAAEGRFRLTLGVNILLNEFDRAFVLASRYKGHFIQIDHVAGRYTRGELPAESYQRIKREHPDIVVLGGVWPKYYQPVQGSDLKADLRKGMKRADAIVVTGEGTGKETPLKKIQEFRRVLGTHPLIIGAGLTPKNAYEQLRIADGAIVGSSLKPGGDTNAKVDKYLIRHLMTEVRRARA